METKEIRDLTTPEIEEQIKSSKEEPFNPCFRLATGQLEETVCIRTARKTIVCLETAAREREIEQSKVDQ